MNHHGQQQAERIDSQVPLATRDFLGRIIASLFTAFGRANRLAVDNRYRRRRLLAYRSARFGPQGVVNLLPSAIISPAPKNSVHRTPVESLGAAFATGSRCEPRTESH